jgi:hypothetical protein
MAVDDAGNSLLYNGSSWTVSDIDASETINDISCTSSSYCVAVDASGNYLVYSGSPSPSWSSATVINQYENFYAVSCIGSTYCMAGTSGGAQWTYNGSSWTFLGYLTEPYSIDSISCVSTTWCALVDDDSEALVDNNGSFSDTTLETNTEAIESISCSSASFCAAVDELGNSFTYSGGTWSSADTADAGYVIDGVSCTSSSNCAAVDNDGNFLTNSGGNTWNLSDVDTNYNVTGVSCSATSTFCAAIDSGGRIEGSTASKPFGGAIHKSKQLGIGPLDGVSCTSNTFCMAVTADPSGGDVAAAYNHSAGSKTLYATSVGGLTGDLDAVSCWSTDCMTTNTSGNTFLFSGGSWVEKGSVPGEPSGISCSSGGTCFVDVGGEIYETTNRVFLWKQLDVQDGGDG